MKQHGQDGRGPRLRRAHAAEPEGPSPRASQGGAGVHQEETAAGRVQVGRAAGEPAPARSRSPAGGWYALRDYDEVASAFDNAFYIGHDFGALHRIHKADMVSLW